MQDQWDRPISYARVSITDECNLCCRYCRGEAREKTPERHQLEAGEFRLICRLLGQCGITRFKLTGGEPLLRKEVVELTGWLAGQAFAEEVTMTTNGVLLAGLAAPLKEAGLFGVNVSLDTLCRETWCSLTGQDRLEEVLAGIRSALEAGLRVRINTVAMEGVTERELPAFLELIRELPVDVRFICLMPMGAALTGPRGYSGAEIRRAYQENGVRLTPDQGRVGCGPAVYDTVQGCRGRFGYIDALHENFCSRCNRVRITAAGRLKPCLYDRQSLDIRGMLKAGNTEEEILQAVKDTVFQKPLRHHFGEADAAGRQDRQSMDRIGG